MQTASLPHVCTIVTDALRARGQALADSFREHHPGGRVEIYVADDRDLPGPWLLADLLDDESREVVYLDARIRVAGSLEPVVALARMHGLVLRPQLIMPLDDPEAELASLERGVYDGRFLAIGAAGRRFLEWWRRRVEEEPGFEPARWLNLAPCYVDAAVTAEPSWLELQDEPAESRDPGFGAEPPEPPPAALATPVNRPRAPTRLDRGVNLVVRAEHDRPLDEIADAITSHLDSGGVPSETTRFRITPGESWPVGGADPQGTRFDTAIICLNPLELASFAFHVDAEYFERRRSIGVWFCEETPAPDIAQPLSFLDEVWVPDEPSARALGELTELDVRTFPLAVTTPTREASRAALDLPEGFLFISVSDLGGPFSPGAVERANPFGLVEAFTQAFAAGEDPTLLLRTTNGGQNVAALERLKLTVLRPDVVVRDGPLPRDERRALIATADCYVSLARSEEVGLACREAIARGLPAILTDSPAARLQHAHLVQSVPAPIPQTSSRYWTGETWYEPRLADATRLLRSAPELPAAARNAEPDPLPAFLSDALHVDAGGRPRLLGRVLRRLA